MNIAQLQRLRTGSLPREDGKERLPSVAKPAAGRSFSDTLKKAVNEVDRQQKMANQQVTAFVMGEQENVHEVMLAMEQAKTSFELLVEVRNRLLETYQELMRMQV